MSLPSTAMSPSLTSRTRAGVRALPPVPPIAERGVVAFAAPAIAADVERAVAAAARDALREHADRIAAAAPTIVPRCVAVTSPLTLPAPPKPPTPNTSDGVCAWLLAWMPPLMFMPPLPPPPPMDCAMKPMDCAPHGA